MWFGLLKRRIEKNYYRTQRQMLSDLDQIRINAEQYNGKDHDVADDASALVKKVRGELLRCIDEVGDSQIRERVKQALKLSDVNTIEEPFQTLVEPESPQATAREEQIDTRIQIR